MVEKVGRNDPCPCGSGKKYKQCCLLKKGGGGIKRKLAAVWVNKPVKEGVNLMERTFGSAISDLSSSPPTFLTSHSFSTDPVPDAAHFKDDAQQDANEMKESSQEEKK